MKIRLKNNGEWTLFEGKELQKKLFDQQINIFERVSIADGVKLNGLVTIGSGCIIERETEIGERTVIEADSIIREGCIIRSNSHIGHNVNIGSNCQIGQNTSICASSILRNNVIIGNYCTVGANVYIAEYSQVKDAISIPASAHIIGAAYLQRPCDCMVISPSFLDGGQSTFTLTLYRDCYNDIQIVSAVTPGKNWSFKTKGYEPFEKYPYLLSFIKSAIEQMEINFF